MIAFVISPANSSNSVIEQSVTETDCASRRQTANCDKKDRVYFSVCPIVINLKGKGDFKDEWQQGAHLVFLLSGTVASGEMNDEDFGALHLITAKYLNRSTVKIPHITRNRDLLF